MNKPKLNALNEALDELSNAAQWLQNVKDGTSLPQEGIESVRTGIERVRVLVKAESLRPKAEILLRICAEQITRLEMTVLDGKTTVTLSEAERHVATHMFLWGALHNANTLEERDTVFEAFKIGLGYSDEDVATDILGG